MKEFKSIEKNKTKINNKNLDVFIVKNDIKRSTKEELNFIDLKPEVKIDGIIYKVWAIECYKRAFLYEGETIAILVENIEIIEEKDKEINSLKSQINILEDKLAFERIKNKSWIALKYEIVELIKSNFKLKQEIKGLKETNYKYFSNLWDQKYKDITNESN